VDLLDGIVVHAKQGQRHTYQAIQSRLTKSPKPLDIVNALMDIYPFDTLYIADLNAIQGYSPITHTNTIADIAHRYPTLQIWLDAGSKTPTILNQRAEAKNLTYVLGTENFSELTEYNSCQHPLNYQAILSLDFMSNGYHGPPELLANASDWPQHVIAMTLPRVGTNSGVDHPTLKHLRQLATHQQLYAAGGVRNPCDLQQLQALAIHGALVASALHNKQLLTQDLLRLAQ